MRFTSLCTRTVAVASAAVLAWAVVPADSGAANGLQAASAATPVYLVQPASVFTVVPAIPPAQRNHLPSSIFPHSDAECSVHVPDMPRECSISPTTNRRCSAYCGEDQQCSAFSDPAGGNPGGAVCSSFGRDIGLCSVLQPQRVLINPSQCSAFNNLTINTLECSVLRPGRKQACSSENPGRSDQCSAFGIGQFVRCSVLDSGPVAPRNFCSVGRPPLAGGVTKFCSTFADGAECSIIPGNFALCTHFKSAPAGSCSAQVPVAGSGRR